MRSPDRLILEIARATLEQGLRVVGQLERLLPSGAGPGTIPPTQTSRANGGFATESEMLPQLRAAASALWIDVSPAHTWLLLEEQLLHSRIADLVLVRVDSQAVRSRIDGGWARPLRLAELRALRALRPDRPSTAAAVAAEIRMSEPGVHQVLRRLVQDGFVLREPSGSFRRLAPARSIAQRVVTFEAKRDSPHAALRQARGHRSWASETYVAFDAQFETRFMAIETQYRRLGVGLLKLSSLGWTRILRSRPRRPANQLEASLVGERALGRLLGAPTTDRPERRLPHGHRLSAESEPLIAGHDADWLSGLRDAHSLR